MIFLTCLVTDNVKVLFLYRLHSPIPVAAGSKAWVCGRSLAGIVASNPVDGMEVSLLWMLHCQAITRPQESLRECVRVCVCVCVCHWGWSRATITSASTESRQKVIKTKKKLRIHLYIFVSYYVINRVMLCHATNQAVRLCTLAFRKLVGMFVL